MAALARQPDVTVYEYEYDAPERLADAQQTVKLARLALEERRQRFGDLDDAAARLAVCRVHDVLAVFARTHPRVFEQVTDRSGGPRALVVLTQLARFRAQTDLPEEAAAARVTEFIMGLQ